MLFLALRSASLKTKALFALCSASLKNQSSFCAALCFSEKPKLFLALLSALSQSSFFEERSFREFSLVCSSPAPHQ